MWVFHNKQKVRILSGMCCGWKGADKSGKESVTESSVNVTVTAAPSPAWHFLSRFPFLSGRSLSVQDRGPPGRGGEVQWEVRDSECKGSGLSAQGKHQEQRWVFLIGKHPTALRWNRPFLGAELAAQLWVAGNTLCLEESSDEAPGSGFYCFYWVFSACSGSFCPWPRARSAWWSMTSWTSCPSPATLQTSLLSPPSPRSEWPQPLSLAQTPLSWPRGVKDLKPGNFLYFTLIYIKGRHHREEAERSAKIMWVKLGELFFL